jgi:uridine kinase
MRSRRPNGNSISLERIRQWSDYRPMGRTVTERTVIVAITGGSGAGKTTVADALAAALAPINVALLREDDYYNDNAATAGFVAEEFNFDHVEARDHSLLSEHLATLKAGGAVDMPRYDFISHGRLPERTRLGPADVVIVEGTHVLHPPTLRALYDLAVYLDVPDDIRLTRRIRRDVAERGRSVETVTAQYLGTVRPMHYRFTEPGRVHAHVIGFDEDLLIAGHAAQMAKLRETVDALARTVRERLSLPAL